MIKKVHFWVGVTGLVAFILSGQYFQHALDGLQGLEDTPRLLLRSSHIYLFFASMLNLLLGLYYVEPTKVGWATIYNQSFILLAPFLIGYGFVFETLTNEGIDRTVGSTGVIFVFVWVANIVIGRIYSTLKSNKALKQRDAAGGAP